MSQCSSLSSCSVRQRQVTWRSLRDVLMYMISSAFGASDSHFISIIVARGRDIGNTISSADFRSRRIPKTGPRRKLCKDMQTADDASLYAALFASFKKCCNAGHVISGDVRNVRREATY